jgi:hypothetical protein
MQTEVGTDSLSLDGGPPKLWKGNCKSRRQLSSEKGNRGASSVVTHDNGESRGPLTAEIAQMFRESRAEQSKKDK